MPNFAPFPFLIDFHSIDSQNSFSSLSTLDSSGDPLIPIHTSSPQHTQQCGAHSCRKQHKPKHQSQRQLKALVINFQGLENKSELASELINSTQPDIIFGTETWAKEQDANGELFPNHVEHYNIWRKDRSEGNKEGYGGVLIAVRNDLLATPEPQYNTKWEIKWAKLTIGGSREVYLGSYYHPHYNDIDGLVGLEESMNKLPKDAIKILAGDFNLPDIDWQTNSTKPYSKLNISEDHCLEQIVHFPTRKENTLDLFFTNNPSLIDSVKPIPGISDHDSIVQVNFKISAPVQKTKPHKIYKFKQANFDKMREELSIFSSEYFQNNPHLNSVDTNWRSLKKKLLEVMDKYIPSKMSSTRFNLPYVTRDIKRKIKKKQRLYNKARKTKKEKDWSKFKILRKNIQTMLKNARWKYLNEIIGPSLSENPKAFYGYTKKLKQEWGSNNSETKEY
jgi:hypothetical protein